jgi:hypothetical protein
MPTWRVNRCERGSTAGGELTIGEAVRILREVPGRPALVRKNALDPRGSMTTRRRRVYWWNQLTLFGWTSYR